MDSQLSDNFLLDIRELEVVYHSPRGLVRAVDKASLRIERGKVLGLVGESGSGKSTVALSILRLLPSAAAVHGGQIWYKGHDLVKEDDEFIRAIRGKSISLVFQEPMSALNPVQKIGKQVEEMVKLHRHVSHREARDVVLRCFKEVRLPDAESLFSRYPHELSGGMKQRVIIAMAISCNPQLLIADEPTSALDVTIQAQIIAVIKHLIREKSISVLFISHNLALVSEICDAVAVMYAGRIVEMAQAQTIFCYPKHPYTRGLLNCTPRVDGTSKDIKPIKGEVPDLTVMQRGCTFCPRCEEADGVCMEKAPELRLTDAGHEVSCWRYQGDI